MQLHMQQSNHAARSCRTQVKSRATLAKGSQVNLFGLSLAPSALPVIRLASGSR